MRGRWIGRWSVALLGAVLGLALLTPLGPSALARLLERGGGDWRVAVGSSSGALLYGFSLTELRCTNPALGFSLEIEQLTVAPWAWAVEIRAPQIRIAPIAEAAASTDEAPTAIELPIAYLPALSISAGQLQWSFGASSLVAHDWRASYRAIDDSSGRLIVELPQLQIAELPLRALKLDLALSPHRIERGVLEAWGSGDSLEIELRSSFELGLGVSRPVKLVLEATVEAPLDSLNGRLQAEVSGALQPLQLAGTLSGEGQVPGLSAVEWQGQLHTDGARFNLDSLRVELLGGEITGRTSYALAGDSLAVQLRGVGIELVVPTGRAGRVGFSLDAAANLAHERYAADLTAILRDVELVSGERLDIELQGRHRPDGSTRLALQSRLLELVAEGVSDLEGGYDLALRGTMWPAAYVDGAAPVQIAGRALPDSLVLALETAHLPGVLGRAFGPLRADVQLLANRHLGVALHLERDLLVAETHIDLQRSRVDTLVLALDGLTLDRLVPGLDGRVSAQISGGGGLALAELRLQGEVQISDLVYAGWKSGALEIDVEWARGVGRGALQSEGLRARVLVDSLKRLEAQAEFAGILLRGGGDDEVGLQGTLRWAGALEDPGAGEGLLDLDSLFLRQSGWVVRNRAPLALGYRHGQLDLAAVQMQTPLGPLDLSGRIGPDSLAVEASWPSLTLDGVVPDLGGGGEGHLRVGGTLERPLAQGAWALDGLRLDTLVLGDARLRLALADSLRIEAELRQGPEAGLVLDLACPAAPLMGMGEGRATLGLAAVAVDLGPVLSYALGQPLEGWFDAGGIVTAPLGKAPLAWDELSGEFELSSLYLETQVEEDSLRLDLLTGGRLALREGRVVLDTLEVEMRRYDRDRLFWRSAGKMRLEGEAFAAGSSRLGLALEDVDLVFFAGPEGLADLEAQLSNVGTDPHLAIELAVDTEDLGELRGRLAGNGQGGDVHLSWTTLLEDSLVVTGRVPWDFEAGTLSLDEGWLEVHSEGIGLFVFGDLVPYLDHLDGWISADLRVEGLDSTLAVHGRMGFEEFEFALLDIEPVYTLPSGELKFDKRRVQLAGFAASGARGKGYRRFELGGNVDLARLDEPVFDLRLRADDVACGYEDIFRADDIDLDLAFSGSSRAAKLAGHIRLTNPRSEPTLVVFNAPPVPPPPPALRDEFLESLALGIEIEIRDLEVDSELVELAASGAIDVGGTFYKPLFQGDVAIDEGRILVLNQQFEFDESRVVFNSLEPTRSILDVAYDPLELDPELDLRATTQVRDIQDNNEEYTVTLTLQGRARSAVPQFASDPTLDFNRIINLLAFNTTSTRNLDYTTALGTAAGQLLSKRVEKVGLDEFAVLPSSAVVGSEPGVPALRMGKYFANLPLPIWVRYEAVLREMSSGEVRLEHKLTSYLTITGSAQSEYDRYGLGIGLKKDF